jgi:hypothetical protein
MSNNGQISLRDKLNRRWFEQAMQTLTNNKGSLSQYDRDLVNKLSDGYAMVGDELTVTTKQMNHIKSVAADLEVGCYEPKDIW